MLGLRVRHLSKVSDARDSLRTITSKQTSETLNAQRVKRSYTRRAIITTNGLGYPSARRLNLRNRVRTSKRAVSAPTAKGKPTE